mmetsp:Transcript_30724/g.59932  ORF Transcript_30724/g.59932 Transcript_30724/m.59932 type:complete len:212 (-) Transcript_30724:259-894(-)
MCKANATQMKTGPRKKKRQKEVHITEGVDKVVKSHFGAPFIARFFVLFLQKTAFSFFFFSLPVAISHGRQKPRKDRPFFFSGSAVAFILLTAAAGEQGLQSGCQQRHDVARNGVDAEQHHEKSCGLGSAERILLCSGSRTTAKESKVSQRNVTVQEAEDKTLEEKVVLIPQNRPMAFEMCECGDGQEPHLLHYQHLSSKDKRQPYIFIRVQ